MGRVYVKVRLFKDQHPDSGSFERDDEEGLADMVYIPHGRVREIDTEGFVVVGGSEGEGGTGILVGWVEGDDPASYIEREGIDAKS